MDTLPILHSQFLGDPPEGTCVCPPAPCGGVVCGPEQGPCEVHNGRSQRVQQFHPAARCDARHALRTTGDQAARAMIHK